jgi:hypothetical protein
MQGKQKQQDSSTSAAWFKRDPRQSNLKQKRGAAFYHRTLTATLGRMVTLRLDPPAATAKREVAQAQV